MQIEPVTAESIARAKQQQQAERQRVFELTGVRVTDHGLVHPPYRIHCTRTGCRFTASARSEGRAVRALATHLVLGHMERK